MYLITDSYGTRQRAWTRAGALKSLRHCGPDAEIRNLWGRLIAARRVG